MATHPTRSMAARLAAAERILEQCRSEPAIRTRLARVGFDEGRLEEGETRLAVARVASEEAEAARQAQRVATTTLRRQREQLAGATRDAQQLARFTLGERHPWLVRAGVGQDDGASLEALLTRAHRFFDTAAATDGAAAAALWGVGLGPEAIRLGQALIQAVEQAAEQRTRRQREAERRTTARAEAFVRLDEWLRDATAVARIAFRDRPHFLAQLGIRPRGRPRKG